MDHSQKTCYHCNRKGHIKANCPARKRLDAKPCKKKDNRVKRNWTGKRKGKVLLQSVGSSEKEIHWKRPIHPTVRRGFSVEAGTNCSLTLATLNALEPDPGDNPSKEPSTDPPLQTDSANHPQAICISVETEMELALTDTVQVTRKNQISTRDGPPTAE